MCFPMLAGFEDSESRHVDRNRGRQSQLDAAVLRGFVVRVEMARRVMKPAGKVAFAGRSPQGTGEKRARSAWPCLLVHPMYIRRGWMTKPRSTAVLASAPMPESRPNGARPKRDVVVPVSQAGVRAVGGVSRRRRGAASRSGVGQGRSARSPVLRTSSQAGCRTAGGAANR